MERQEKKKAGTHYAYPSYKESGIEWLSEVPADWSAERLRFYTEVNPVKSEVRGLDGDTLVSFVPMEAIGEDGSLRLDQTKAIDEVSTGYTYFRDGDVIVAKITPCFENGKGAIAQGLENGIGFGTTELHVMRPGKVLDRDYLFYLLMSHAFRGFGTATMYGAGGQKRVPEDFIQDFKHPIPPIDDQKTIAAFLGRETERIYQLIARKERQIELLQEKRTALISHAVTKGLNLKAKMKDSRIEWLGEIPERWELQRLKYVFLFSRGVDLSADNFIEGPYPVCASNGIIGYHDKYSAKGPSIIVGRSGSVGEVNYIDSNFWAHNTALFVTKFYKAIPRYSYYLLLVLDLKSLSAGTAVGTLNRNYIHDLVIAVPSMEEQEAISLFLDRETARIDALIEKVKKSIELLREYRTTLISGAVTGKIDVRKEVVI